MPEELQLRRLHLVSRCVCVFVCMYVFVRACTGVCIPEHTCEGLSTTFVVGPPLPPCWSQVLSSCLTLHLPT